MAIHSANWVDSRERWLVVTGVRAGVHRHPRGPTPAGARQGMCVESWLAVFVCMGVRERLAETVGRQLGAVHPNTNHGRVFMSDAGLISYATVCVSTSPQGAARIRIRGTIATTAAAQPPTTVASPAPILQYNQHFG